MQPSDAAVEAAAEAMYRYLNPSFRGTGKALHPTHHNAARAALSAALPIIREELAQEIEAATDNLALYDAGRADAARIVRGNG